jgi:DNA-binding response OmpR family regulator
LGTLGRVGDTETDSSATGGGRILIVEDDPRIAAFMVKGLGKSGFDVTWVDTGRAGVDHVAGTGTDLLLLDLGLPDIDGLDVLREVRGLCPDVPVIVVTARTDAHDRAAALRSGARTYLVKPFAWADLLTEVGNALSANGTTTSNVAPPSV